MANSFGPSGGKDPIAEGFKEAVDKSAGVVNIESQKIVDSFKVMMDRISKQVKELKGPFTKQKDKENTAEFKAQERSKKSLEAQRNNALNREADAQEKSVKSLESQRSNAYSKDLNEQDKARASLEAKRSAALNRDMDAQQRSREKLEAQRSNAIKKELDEQEAARKSLESKRSAALSKEMDEQEKARKSLEAQRSNALNKEFDRIEKEKKDAEKNAKAKKDREERLQTKWDKMLADEAKKASEDKKEKAKADINAFFGFIDTLKGSFKDLINVIGTASKYVAAFNPGLVFQLSFAMRDLVATIGMALQPVVEGATAAVRNFADMLVPIARDMQPVLASLVEAFLNVFVKLMPTFYDLLQVLTLFIKVGVYLVNGFSGIMMPVIWALEGFAIVLTFNAIRAVITFATTLITTSALMTGGLSLLLGGIASLFMGLGKASGILKDFDFKPGASVGIGTRQASYSGLTEFGKNILAQGLGSSAASAASQTANNTKRCADILQQMADDNKGNGRGQRQVGGNGVAKNNMDAMAADAWDRLLGPK